MNQRYEEIQSFLHMHVVKSRKEAPSVKVPISTPVNISLYRYKTATKTQKLLRLLALALSLQLQQLPLITMKTHTISTLINTAAFDLPLRVCA